MNKADLCNSCGKRPKLSLLSRCTRCLTEQVERDRKTREAKRLAAKKPKADAGNGTWRAGWKIPKLDRQRCAAKTRAGHACKRLPVEGKERCINHGGLSTGPVTPEGIAVVTLNLARTPSWQKRVLTLAQFEKQ